MQMERTNPELIYDLVKLEGFTKVLAVSIDWTPTQRERTGINYLIERGIETITTSPDNAICLLDHPSTDPEHTLVYMVTHFSLWTYPVHRVISRKGFRCLGRYMGLLPVPTRRVRPSLGSAKAWAAQWISEFMMRHPARFGVSPVDFFIYAGRRVRNNPPFPVGPDTRYIVGHTGDYDTYIELMKNPCAAPGERTAVFLDSNDFHSPDLPRLGRDAGFPWEDRYFARLRTFFDYIEAALGVRVVVAAHPLEATLDRAKYGGREVIQGKTGELVMNASLVIAHYSTAINLGVILEKPIIFLTDVDYKKAFMGPMIEAMAWELGTVPLRIDTPLKDWDLESLMKIDHDAYRRYTDEYIKEIGS